MSEWALALLHPRSWSLDGNEYAIKDKDQTIFPHNYVMRYQPADAATVTAAAVATAAVTAAAVANATDIDTTANNNPAAAHVATTATAPAASTAPEYAHEWLYYPSMTFDEALVFVNFDSDESQPQFVMHGAFNPEPEPEAEPELEGCPKGKAGGSRRISVEVRLLVLIERAEAVTAVS